MIEVDNNEYFFSKIYLYVHDESCNAMYASGYDIVWGGCLCMYMMNCVMLCTRGCMILYGGDVCVCT